MTTGEKQNVSRHGAHAVHHAVCAGSNLLRGFAARTAVAEQLPSRTFGADLRRTAAFVFAVVPLDEVVVDFNHRSEAGQFTCAPGALQGTRPYSGELDSTKPLTKFSGIALAALGQW